jgi:hypothetical protein
VLHIVLEQFSAALLPLLPGTIILTAAEHEAMLYVGRVILGFGVGFAIQVQLLTHRSSQQPCFLHADRRTTKMLLCWKVWIRCDG